MSAWRWARSPKPGRSIWYEELLTRSRRCPDPFVRVRGRWIIRRLAPDCSRIELSSLPEEHDACRLLHCMGWETANIHLGSEPAGILLKAVTRYHFKRNRQGPSRRRNTKTVHELRRAE